MGGALTPNQLAGSYVQPKLLSKISETLVLRAISQHGPCTRSEVSQFIGVTFPTVAKAVASLLDAQLLEEFDDSPSGPGRPAKRLRLASESSQVIGVSIDEETSSIVAAGFDGGMILETREEFATPRDYDELLAELKSRIGALVERDGVAIQGVGLSVPGLVDYRRQRVRFSANIPMLNERPLPDQIRKLTGVECLMVHDSHALCLAERLYGEAKSLSTFAILDLCKGIGMGVMINGEFLIGKSGYAGELGHNQFVPDGPECHCGRRGCLETVASEWALIQQASQRLGRALSFEEIAERDARGDAVVRGELQQTCDYLGVAVADIVNLFNPEAVFLAGRIFELIPWSFDRVLRQAGQKALEHSFEDCRFLPGRGSHLQGAVAAMINYRIASRLPETERTASAAS
jgi:N-acetylglucosamine repressor